MAGGKRTAAAGLVLAPLLALAAEPPRQRLRELGVVIGALPTGPRNAITDVAGVRVGHRTVVEGEAVRTGVTAVLPHGGNLFQEKVPGAVFVGNGFGKLMGSTQVEELGEIETPIVLTGTLSVPRAADALLDYVLGLPGNEEVRSVNALVAETNDGRLSDIRARPIRREHVLEAIRAAGDGPVTEGSVGAGTGTIAFGFKGGIGTASRKVPAGYTVGVLVQTNFGGSLLVDGVPVGRELAAAESSAKGSVIIVLATDAPADARNLKRLAARAMLGLARTGASGDNGSGDYAIAFSTEASLRVPHGRTAPRTVTVLPNDAMSPLFLAAIEATEEAILNSLTTATTVTGNGRTAAALPLDRLVDLLRRYGRLR